MFKKGDFIYYYKKVDESSGSVPAKVLQVHAQTLKIEANFNEGTRIVRVKKSKCELQNIILKIESTIQYK